MKSSLLLLVAFASSAAAGAGWQPAPGHEQLRLWPGAAPDLKPMPGPESVQNGDLVNGKQYVGVANVSVPTMTVYPPAKNNTGAAVLVIPGGGFEMLAIDLEGTDVCDWLTGAGVTCVLLKYRVPSLPYDWKTNRRPDNLQVSTQSLEDTQRAMGLIRLHAREWNIDPKKVGVLGFSAGGFLVAEISTLWKKRLYVPFDAADQQTARPDFAVALYPGHLERAGKLNANLKVARDTPPTLLVQAEDDPVDEVEESLVYFEALKKAGVPAELHIFAAGGHAFALRKTQLPIAEWPHLVETWLRTIGATEGSR